MSAEALMMEYFSFFENLPAEHRKHWGDKAKANREEIKVPAELPKQWQDTIRSLEEDRSDAELMASIAAYVARHLAILPSPRNNGNS